MILQTKLTMNTAIKLLNLLKTAPRCYVSAVQQSRSISLSAPFRTIFTVQDEDDFQEKVVKSSLPVVIDFQARWCGPCKILEPRLENIVGKYHDKVHLAKVDIDTNSDLALDYNVQAVPFVLGFKDGKPKNSFLGVMDDDKIESFVKELIG